MWLVRLGELDAAVVRRAEPPKNSVVGRNLTPRWQKRLQFVRLEEWL